MQPRPQSYQPNLRGASLTGASPLQPDLNIIPGLLSTNINSTVDERIDSGPLFSGTNQLFVYGNGGQSNRPLLPTVGQSPMSVSPNSDGGLFLNAHDPLFQTTSGNNGTGMDGFNLTGFDSQPMPFAISPMSLITPNDQFDVSPQQHHDSPGNIGDSLNGGYGLCTSSPDASQSLPLPSMKSWLPSNQPSPLIVPSEISSERKRPVSLTPPSLLKEEEAPPFVFGKSFSPSSHLLQTPSSSSSTTTTNPNAIITSSSSSSALTRKSVEEGHQHHRSEFLLDPPPASERIIPEGMPTSSSSSSSSRGSSYRSKGCAFYFQLGRCQKGDKCNFSHEAFPGMEIPPLPINIQQQQQQSSSLLPISVGNSPQIGSNVSSPSVSHRAVSPPGSHTPHNSSTPRLIPNQNQQQQQVRTPPSTNTSPITTTSSSSGTTSSTFRTKPCKYYFEKGTCLKGDHCNFSHDPSSLLQSQRVSIPSRSSHVSSSAPTRIFVPGTHNNNNNNNSNPTSARMPSQLPSFSQQPQPYDFSRI